MTIEAVGTNGRMIFNGELLTISRKGTGLLTTMNLGLQGDKVIPIGQITAVELRPAGTFIRGYLRLSINGRDPVGGVQEAIRDENAIIIDKAHVAACTALRDALVEGITRSRSLTSSAPASVADEIEKLAALKDRGILTEAEFSSKKLALLGL